MPEQHISITLPTERELSEEEIGQASSEVFRAAWGALLAATGQAPPDSLPPILLDWQQK